MTSFLLGLFLIFLTVGIIYGIFYGIIYLVLSKKPEHDRKYYAGMYAFMALVIFMFVLFPFIGMRTRGYSYRGLRIYYY